MKRKTGKLDKLNKITSTQPIQDKTQERKMSIALLESPLLDKNCNDEKNMENIIERTESEENLLKAIQETENLRNKLKQKKEELDLNKTEHDSDLLLINKNIKEKSEKLEEISNNTKLLLNKLNSLNNQINKGYNKVKIFQAANKIKMNYLNELKIKDKKRVMQGKKIILMNNKIIDRFKTKKEKLEKIIEEDKNLKINDDKKTLETLRNYENEIKKEVQDLRLMKTIHEKKCFQKNEDLNNVLKIIKNEFDNEYKLKNKENKKIKYIKKDEISISSTLPKISSSNNLKSSDNSKVLSQEDRTTNSNNSKIPSRNYKSLTHLFGEDYLIQQDLKEVKNQISNVVKSELNQKLRRYITSYNEEKKKKNIKNVKNDLFSKVEKDMLTKVIPKECLEIYQDKFKTIENQRLQIKEKLNKNETRKKINEEKSQILFITERKDINITRKNIELTSKIAIIKRKIKIIIKEINIIQNGLNNISEKYNSKKEENDTLKNHWTEFNDDIKNKRIGVKKGETISNIELEDLNKWGNHIKNTFNQKIKNEESCDNNNIVNKNKFRKKDD